MKMLSEILTTPLWGEYDVIVAGGGIAGVCAAVAARRTGAQRVLLLEKGILFGGLATQGLIALYEPICDGCGRKITYGMASELMQLCMKYGPDYLPEAWRSDPDEAPADAGRYKTFYSHALFAMALDEFVRQAGVEILFDTQVVRPIMEGARCTGLVVENKDGRGYFTAGAVVDTTGDADIFHRAGDPCVTGRNFMTYIAYRIDQMSMERAQKSGNILNSRFWYALGAGPRENGHPEGLPLISGTTAREITDFVLYGRSMAFDRLRQEDRFSRDITALPTMPQLRTTRHITAACSVQESDVNREQPDSVGAVADFQTPGEWYEIPYRALYNPKFDNLFTAGRTAAADGWAWVVVRIIPGAACSGQAAGVAAALCLKYGCAASELPYGALIDALTAAGVRPHPLRNS